MAKEYNLKNIRTLLIEGFSEADLRDFCFDTPTFRPLHHQLSQQADKVEIVRRLIAFTEQNALMKPLLSWAKEHNPTRYEKHQPYAVGMTNIKFRDKFKYHLRRSGYNQLELAHKLHVDASTISKWVNGKVPWPVDALTRVCELLELDKEEKQELFALAGLAEWPVEPEPFETPQEFLTPRPPLQRPPRVPYFTGRKDELKQLLADLQPGYVITLCGPGGIGKTALAAEALWTLAPGYYPPDRFPDGIIFHSFYNQPQADYALQNIALAFGEKPRPTLRDAARRALAGRKVLLVLDGAENTNDLQEVLDVASNCAVLVTTRRRKDAVAKRQDIAPLSLEEAVALLKTWGGRWALNEVATYQICILVGGLPLAIRLVGHYLVTVEEEAMEYLTWLKEAPLMALDQGQRQLDSVPLLMEKSVNQLSERARQVLQVVSLFALAPFSQEVVAEALEISAVKARQLLGELVNFGLLLRVEQLYLISHALVFTYAKQRMTAPIEVVRRLAAYHIELAEEWGAKDTKIIVRSRGHQIAAVTGFARSYWPLHIMTLLTRFIERGDWEMVWKLALAIDSYLSLKDDWNDKLFVWEAGLAAAHAVENSQWESKALYELGNIYHESQQRELAIKYYEQALSIDQERGIREREISCLVALGRSYDELRQHELAIKYYEQALSILEKDSQPADSGLLFLMGSSYYSLGQRELAIKYYEQVATKI